MKTFTILIILAACLFACRAQEDALVEVVPIEEPAAPQSAFDLVSRLVAGEREGIFAPSHIFHSELDPTARSFAEFAGFLREHGIVFTPSSEKQPTISYGSPSSSEVVVHVQGHLSVASTGQVWAGESVSFVRAAGGQVVEFRAWSSDPLGLAEALRPRTPAAALRALVHYWSHGFAAAFTKVQRPDALAHFHGFDQFWPGLAGSLKLGTLEGVQTLTALLGSDHLSNFQLQVISEHDNQVFGQVTLDRKNSLTKAKDQLGSHYVVLQTDDEGKVTFISLYLDTALIPEEAETKTARKHEAEVRRKEEKQQSKQQKKQQKAAAAAQAAQALVE